MRLSIRREVFETNSSSVHSVVIFSPDDKEKYEQGWLIVSSKVKEELLEALDIKIGEAIPYDDLVERLKAHKNDKDFRGFFKEWYNESKSVEDLLNDNEEFKKEDRLVLLRLNGFWSNDCYLIEDSYRNEFETRTPDGEKIVVVCANGFS